MPRRPDYQRIAAILTYAKEHGDLAACRRFQVSRSTLYNWRRLRDRDSVLEALCETARKRVLHDWLSEARAARSTLTKRVLQLVDKAGVEQLREVVGALKIVSDAILANEVVNPEPRAQVQDAPDDPDGGPTNGGRPGGDSGVEESGGETPPAGGGGPTYQ